MRTVATCALAACAVAGCSVIATFDGLAGPAPPVGMSDAGTDSGMNMTGLDGGSDGTATDAMSAVDASDGAPHLDYGAVVLADAPDLYWRFEDANQILDSSGNDHSGTILGNVTLGAQGAIAGGGKGASFAAGAISGGQILPFTGNAPFTVEVWAMIANGNYQNFAGRELDPADGWTFFVNGGVLILERENAGGPDHATSAGGIPTGVYTHLVGSYDGVMMRIYVNGVLAGAQASSLALPGASGVPFLAGDNNDGGTGRFTGMLDELAVYHVALPDSAILKHYKVGTGAL